ncbi:MAG: serine--tRNA ligase [bacterium]|nr:serine--tRNA ligase [bacterium]
MIDIQFLRDNPELVSEKSQQKGYSVDVAKILELDSTLREIKQQVEVLRTKRNEIAGRMKSGDRPTEDDINEGKQIKLELAGREELLNKADAEFSELLSEIPNPTFDDVPVGDESQSVEIKKWGEQKTVAQDHLDFAIARDWIDFERGAKVAGSKFYFVKDDLALLENAITQFALNYITAKGFQFMTVPHMANSKIMSGTGFAPKSSEQSDEYAIEGEDLSLIATAEIPLTGYHSEEIIDESKLPLRYAALSPCYRKEAGTYGKHTRGLFRVHQFSKLEMYIYCLPEQSKDLHEQILAIEEEIWQALGIPYHIINIASGDLGAPAAKKYDLEYWSPVDGTYRELTSCSNCTDYQARRLNIRVRRADGKNETLHTLNGTAVALARSLIAVIENYQTEDGKLKVPEVLKPYLGGRELL